MEKNIVDILAITLFVAYFGTLQVVDGCVFNTTTVLKISELEAVGTIVANFTILGSIQTVTITPSSSFTLVQFGNSLYGLNLTSVLIYTRNSPVQLFNLQCTDTNNGVQLFQFIIQIDDADNYPPEFLINPYEYNILQSLATVNTSLTPNPKAVDNYDSSTVQTITYAIVENVFNASYFKITTPDSQSVTVIIQKALLYRESPSYKLMIKAIDTEKATGLVKFEVNTTLIVNLINDEPPTFSASKYQSTILSNAFKNTPILMQPTSLKAYDADTTKNRNLTYSISGYPDHFSINQTTGVVYLIINNPDSGTYILTVTATLINDVKKSSSVLAIVTVLSVFTTLQAEKTNSSIINPTPPTWSFIIMGIALALIIVIVVIIIIMYKKECFNSDKKSHIFGIDQSVYSYEDLSGTTVQKNPIEGYNNFVFEDDGQFGDIYRSDSNVSAMSFSHNYVVNSLGYHEQGVNNINDSIRTSSGTTSFTSLQNKFVDENNKTLLNNNNNLEVFIADNAIYASSSFVNNATAEKSNEELTVYF